ncbi:hypothetical protein KAF44_25905 (plasmid) [Cupriavidus necator]|nr:hypothetical protein KAF44_25905 [Cupriavidus necator]
MRLLLFGKHQLVHASVDYVHPHQNFCFPASVLPDALSLLRQEIESAIQLETALHPDFQPWLESGLVRNGQAKNEFAYGITVTLLAYIEMLVQLSETDRNIAKAELARWPRGTAIAERLSIAGAAASGFFSPMEVRDAFVEMSDENFWDSSAEQDVSTALGLRWSELPEATRREIEQRIVRGPIPSYGPASASEENQAYVRLSRLYALKEAGIDLTTQYASELSALRAEVPSWTESAWQERPRTGVFSVSLDTDSSVFCGVPLNNIVDVAREHHGKRARRDVESAPFLGLARDQPGRALRALDLASRRKEFSAELWQTLLSGQVSLSGRIATMAARRMVKLPAESLSEIRRQAARWLHEHALDVWQVDPQAFTDLWNALLGTLLANQTEATRSASRRWVNESLNSTAGQLVGALFATLAESSATMKAGLDASLKKRIAQLLNLPPPLCISSFRDADSAGI